ncbi:MAG: site-specific integrase [Acidobacteria bacterium]|nr:site-specific integrase [Acidobacteriota bacterium]
MISRIDRRPRKNGKVSWRVRVWKGRDESGKGVFDSHTFDAKAKAEDFLKTLNADEPAGGAVSFRSYVAQWLNVIEATRTYNTWRRYTMSMKPILAELGAVRLDKLTAAALEGVYVDLYKTLSARTVLEIHGAVRAALNRAVKQKILRFNPALGCSLRPSDTAEAKVISTDEIEALEAASNDSWVGIAVRLAADLGCRRGELAGLRWQDLDREGKLLIWQSVFERDDGTVGVKPTKTRSQRRVALSKGTLAYLEVYRERQARDAALIGDAYRRDLNLIFARPDGDYVRPDYLSKVVCQIADKAGFVGIGLHSLRHSHASLMLSAGAPLAAVSKRLGHRDSYTTAKIYQHALPSDEAKLADIWETVRGREKPVKMVKNGQRTPKRTGSSRQNA